MCCWKQIYSLALEGTEAIFMGEDFWYYMHTFYTGQPQVCAADSASNLFLWSWYSCSRSYATLSSPTVWLLRASHSFVMVGNGWDGGARFSHLYSISWRIAAGPDGMSKSMLSIAFSSFSVNPSCRPRAFQSRWQVGTVPWRMPDHEDNWLCMYLFRTYWAVAVLISFCSDMNK